MCVTNCFWLYVPKRFLYFNMKINFYILPHLPKISQFVIIFKQIYYISHLWEMWFWNSVKFILNHYVHNCVGLSLVLCRFDSNVQFVKGGQVCLNITVCHKYFHLVYFTLTKNMLLLFYLFTLVNQYLSHLRRRYYVAGQWIPYLAIRY